MSGKEQLDKDGELKIGELPELNIVGLDGNSATMAWHPW